MLHGNAPWFPSAYGQQLRLLGKQLRSLGHEVAFSANYGLNGAGLNYEGMQVFPAADGNNASGCSLLPGHAEKWRADLVIALGDAWYWPAYIMNNIPCRLALWMPIDCSPLGTMDQDAIEQMPKASLIAMSTHGMNELEAAGHDATYIPHAYDPAVYKPYDAQLRAVQRAGMSLQPDDFVIGICAANKDTVRKGFTEQLRAFADFHARHANSRLLLHTLPDKSAGGIDLRALASLLDIDDVVTFPSPYALATGLYSGPAMASWFNALDLLSSCSWGEGFGVPVIEAQACGTPVVSTNFSGQATLPAKWRVKGDRWWIDNHRAWWERPNVGEIEAAYEDAFHQWQSNTDLRTPAAAGVQGFASGQLAGSWDAFLQAQGLVLQHA